MLPLQHKETPPKKQLSFLGSDTQVLYNMDIAYFVQYMLVLGIKRICRLNGQHFSTFIISHFKSLVNSFLKSHK